VATPGRGRDSRCAAKGLRGAVGEKIGHLAPEAPRAPKAATVKRGRKVEQRRRVLPRGEKGKEKWDGI